MLTAAQVADLLALIDAYADRKLEREHEKATRARRKLVRALEALMRPNGWAKYLYLSDHVCRDKSKCPFCNIGSQDGTD